MKVIYKHWITSVIGTLLMLLGGYMFYQEKPLGYTLVVFAIGLASLWAKDDLIKKLIGKV
jgi:hypothetical protein